MKPLPTRLTLGRYVLGPDFHGCINTGTAPAMLKARVLAPNTRWASLTRGFRFAVGPHVYVEDAITALLYDRIDGKTYYERKGHNNSRVRFFKTYASAKKYFATLVAEAEKTNARVRAEEQALRKRAVKGDLNAALGLMDYLS